MTQRIKQRSSESSNKSTNGCFPASFCEKGPARLACFRETPRDNQKNEPFGTYTWRFPGLWAIWAFWLFCGRFQAPLGELNKRINELNERINESINVLTNQASPRA
jgi:hypothetical protein